MNVTCWVKVSPKEESVRCIECHTRDNSRIAGLTDFYIPGRDRYSSLEEIGKWLIILTIFGVLIHSAIRIYSYRKLKNGMKE